MAPTSHDDLRRLAVWLARRREVDEMMAVLTQYGPTASERVATHLDALRLLLEEEADAFRRYAQGAPELPQKALPVLVPEEEREEPSNVHSLFAARYGRVAPEAAE